jgi:hypothetical protein
MTNEEVIALAQKAGLLGKWEEFHKVYTTFSIAATPKLIEAQLGGFARLVRNAALESAARVCDDKHYAWRFGDESGPKDCAEVIRAMKEETK